MFNYDIYKNIKPLTDAAILIIVEPSAFTVLYNPLHIKNYESIITTFSPSSPVAQIADWVDDSLRVISGSKWST